jgi:hypothetical protein
VDPTPWPMFRAAKGTECEVCLALPCLASLHIFVALGIFSLPCLALHSLAFLCLTLPLIVHVLLFSRCLLARCYFCLRDGSMMSPVYQQPLQLSLLPPPLLPLPHLRRPCTWLSTIGSTRPIDPTFPGRTGALLALAHHHTAHASSRTRAQHNLATTLKWNIAPQREFLGIGMGGTYSPQGRHYVLG